ncbi:ROK family protein [Candidatus Daviesbacteria bacterium]|nr:ROK family protein [Candidatus Daviesbacteria bacterium]
MFLAVDIGATNTRIGLSEDGHSIAKKEKFSTPADFSEGINLIVKSINDLAENNLPNKISVAVAGVVDSQQGVVLKAPNLIDYNNQPIVEVLENKLQTKVILGNDADFAALGEANLGAGRGYKIVAFITLSTGVGGARVVSGEIDETAIGFEPGHQIFDPNGRVWGCGQRGCFESVASGKAFELNFGVKPENCHNPRIWEEHAKIVSQGLINVIVLWSPDILVLGGSLIKAGQKFLNPLIRHIDENLKIIPTPKIKVSELGDINVLLGGIYKTINQSF